jgi:hypothetical protein
MSIPSIVELAGVLENPGTALRYLVLHGVVQVPEICSREACEGQMRVSYLLKMLRMLIRMTMFNFFKKVKTGAPILYLNRGMNQMYYSYNSSLSAKAVLRILQTAMNYNYSTSGSYLSYMIQLGPGLLLLSLG